MSATRTPPVPPPTVASLKAMGVTGVLVACGNYRRSDAMSFDRLGAASDIAFPMLMRMRLVCKVCGSSEPTVMPDWSGYRPSGSGNR